MKIRSVAELEDAIDRDFAQRKRALTALKFAFDSARVHEKQVIAYGSVCILYAHWERFVKYPGSCFTNYVSRLGLSYQELSNGIIATCIRGQLKGMRNSNSIRMNRDFVELLRDRTGEKPIIPWQSAIDTYDNLNSEVLLEILHIIGCDPSPYETRSVFIDEKLLRHRNRIAHNGYDHEFDISDFPDLYSGVLSLLEQIRTDVQNAASLKYYSK